MKLLLSYFKNLLVISIILSLSTSCMKNGDDGEKKNELTKTDSLQKKIDSLLAIQKNQNELLKNEMEEYQPTPSTIIEDEDCMGVDCNVRELAEKVKNRHRNWDIQYSDSNCNVKTIY